MARLGKTYSAAIAVLGLLMIWAPCPKRAWAGPLENSRMVSDSGAGGDEDEAASKATPPKKKDGRGFKGFAVSLDDVRDNHGLRLKTAVLVKPLKTDQFLVAFTASAPLIHRKGPPFADVHVTLPLRERNNGFHPPYLTPDRETVSDWLVIADWPQSGRLLPIDRGTDFIWIPEMDGSTRWHSKMELVFLPADQWTVRAILSMARDRPQYRQFLSSGDQPSARIGMTIDVDYHFFDTIALGFDYGHWRYGRTFSGLTGDADSSPNPSNPDGSHRSDTIAARLTIRF
jgi:hypothetical protein